MTLRTATVLTSPVRGVCLVVGSLIRSQPIIAFGMCSELTHDLRRGYVTSFPPNQVNDSNKGSNGPAGSRSGKLHSEERA